MQIDFIFDIVCPWCYIGKRRLEQALEMRPHINAVVNWRPFLLNPQLPPDGIDHGTYLTGKFGSERRISRIYGAISDVGQSVAIHFNFDGIRRAPNSMDAHRLIRLAADIDKADACVEALYAAYFINGRNIGEAEVLADIGAGIGLDPQSLLAYFMDDDGCGAVFDDNARAHRLGINGVPAFVFGDSMVISGAQDPGVLARVLDAAAAAEIAA
ncbi:MAG: DsbA family oxidoreductase [Alphaproteobacteria bacterium]